MKYLLKIISTVMGFSTEYDDSFVRVYDPTTNPPTLETTKDPNAAKEYSSALEAMEDWKRSSGRTRYDGKPDRPLTAFSVAPIPKDKAGDPLDPEALAILESIHRSKRGRQP